MGVVIEPHLCTTRMRPRRDLSVTWPSQGTFPGSHRSARGPALPTTSIRSRPCTACGAEAPILVDWRDPLVMCKDCRAKRKQWFLTVHARNYDAVALSACYRRFADGGELDLAECVNDFESVPCKASQRSR